jgi:hypothetical protein
MEEYRVIACNYLLPTNVTFQGAKAYVVRMNPGGGNDRIVVFARSRSGRWVQKWEKIGLLSNFRFKNITPGHPRYFDDWVRYAPHEPKDLERLAEL